MKHGDRQLHATAPEYKSWVAMKKRCTYKKHPAFARYQGLLCDRWLRDYSAFLSDMGRKPSPSHTIDRIDTARGYEPGNCRWATPADQMHNRSDNVRYTHDGQSLTLPEWARKLGTYKQLLRARLMRGLSVAEVLTAKQP